MLAFFPPAVQPYVLPAAVGLGVVLVLLLVLFTSKKRSRRDVPMAPAGVRSSQWTSPVPSFADRRTSTRREGGNPVKVVLASPAFKGSHIGYVLDRSTGGLRMASATGMPVGGSVQVRAAHAPDETPWVTVIVRSCKPSGKGYEMGCEFDKTPPWNILLLFG